MAFVLPTTSSSLLTNSSQQNNTCNSRAPSLRFSTFATRPSQQLPAFTPLNCINTNDKTQTASITCTIAAASTSISTPNPNNNEGQQQQNLLEPVIEINGVEEYLQMLESNKDKLIVLKVFAPWCRSCRALVPKVNRLAREHKDILFLEMNYETNKPLCARLSIYSMPTFLMYFGSSGEIDKFTCGPLRTSVLTQKILEFERGVCILDENKDKQVQQPAYKKSIS